MLVVRFPGTDCREVAVHLEASMEVLLGDPWLLIRKLLDGVVRLLKHSWKLWNVIVRMLDFLDFCSVGGYSDKAE